MSLTIADIYQYVVQELADDNVRECDLWTQEGAYSLGYAVPRFPVPVRKYTDELIQWKGRHWLCVCYLYYPDCPVLITDYYLEVML